MSLMHCDFLDFCELDCKEALWARELFERGYRSVTPIEFYEDIFDLKKKNLNLKNYPYLQEACNESSEYRVGEYSAIALRIENDKVDNNQRSKRERRTITRDLDELCCLIDECRADETCLMSPISYAGRNRTLKNARFMFALVVEIDHLTIKDEYPTYGLDNLLGSFYETPTSKIGLNPTPTYIVCSGSGLHLYYIFDEPIAMYENNKIDLNRYKRALTERLWNMASKAKIQYESINQGFRLVGSYTKQGARAVAFKVGDIVTLDYLLGAWTRNFWEGCSSQKPFERATRFKKSTYTLDEAQKKFPEWYQRRIIDKEPRKPSTFKKHPALYEWWLEKIRDKPQEGFRYYRAEHLCALAVVCGISKERIEQDCEDLIPIFDAVTKDPNNHFTAQDIRAALHTYYHPNEQTYNRKLEQIERKCLVRIQRGRRNGMPQDLHLEIARYKQDIVNPNWRDGNGRPSKENLVREWREKNPNGTKAECHRQTKISRPTIHKFWTAE